MSYARRAPSRRNTKISSRRGRELSRRGRRLQSAERLELRTLMAGDVNPFHNWYYAQDVNNDYTATPLDALLVINELNASGSRQLVANQNQGGQGEDVQNMYLDVNGDGFLTPLDALDIINFLNAGGETGPAVQFRSKVIANDGFTELLPVSGQGTLASPFVYEVKKGDRFSVATEVLDRRPITAGVGFPTFNNDALGVYFAASDLAFNPSVVKLGFSETQTLTLAGVPSTTSGGQPSVSSNMTITVPGFGTTGQIGLFGQTSQRPINTLNIENALNALLGGAGSALVTNSGNTYTIKFAGRMTDVDIQGLISTTMTAGTATPAQGFQPTGVDMAVQSNIDYALNYGALYAALPSRAEVSFEVYKTISATQAVVERIGAIATGDTSTDGQSKPITGPDNRTDYTPSNDNNVGNDGYVRITTPTFVASETGDSTFIVNAPGFPIDDVEGGLADNFSKTLFIGNQAGFTPSVPRESIAYPNNFIVRVISDVTANDDPDAVATEDGGQVTINVLGNDTNNNNQPANKFITGFGALGNQTTFNTAKGVVTLSGGQVLYTPNANQFGTDTFIYGLTDVATPGAAAKDFGLVTVTIAEVNDNPTATVDGPFTTLEDQALVLSTLLGNDSAGVDPTAAGAGVTTFDVLKIAATNTTGWVQPAHGTVTVAGDGLSATYTPTGNYNGPDSFTYVLTDGRGGTSTAVVTLNVTAVNDVPSFTKGADQTVLEDAGAQSVGWATAISAGPADEVASQTVSFLVTGNTNSALFSVQPTVASNGTLTYTPAPNAFGTATITLVIKDNGGVANGGVDTSASQTFIINVTGVNDPPSFTLPASSNGTEDTAGNVATFVTNISPGIGEGTSGQTVSFIVSNNNNALFAVQPTIDATGRLTYTPAPNAFGSATVSVTAKDTGGVLNSGIDTSAAQTFTLNIANTNDPPTANPDAFPVPDGSVAFVLNVLGNDSIAPDVGETLTITSFSIVSGGAPEVVITRFNDRLEVATQLGYFNKPDLVLNYTISDGNGGTATSSATLTFIPNRLPLAVDDTISGVVTEDQAAASTLTVLTNDRSVLFNVADLVITGVSLTDLPAGDAGWTNSISQGDGLSITLVNGNTQIAFKPGANVFGNFTFFYRIDDPTGSVSSPGDYDGQDVGKVTVNIAPENDKPTLTLTLTSDTVLEDSGARSLPGVGTVSPGPFETQNNYDSATFVVTAANPALFAVQPAIVNGTLTYTPASNANGSTTLSIKARDSFGLESDPQSFTVNITAVNDVPTFNVANLPAILEDAAAQTRAGYVTGITAGPADEAGQVLTFGATNNNNALFSVQPAIAADGTLTFTPAANANGTATVTVTLSDNGGVANGGVDQVVHTFTISITAVNDVPSFTKGADQTVNEDAGAQSVAWATALSAGPSDENTQTLSFIVSNNNSALFAVAPTVSPAGVLTYTPAANAFGTATISVQIKDNGGTANGGVDTSAIQTFTINVNAVNDVPSFTKGPNQSVTEDSGAKTVANWATAISVGPANEASQTPTFNVTNNSNPSLFAVAPSISANGTLTFTPAPDANGTATITINVSDSGGTANGGVDTSATQTFDIVIRPVNDVPSFVKGADQTVAEDAGAQSVAWATGISAGPTNESSQTVNFEIVSVTLSGNNQTPLFSTAPAISSTGNLTYTPAANAFGTATVVVRVKDSGGTTDGGVDTSATQSFLITVTSVNDAPPAKPDTFRVFKTAGPALFDVLQNDTPNVDPGETLTITNATIISPTSFPPTTTPTVAVVNNKVQFAPNGYIGDVIVRYTIDDGSGATNSTATADITFNVVNFIPGFITGYVFADVDDDGVLDPAAGVMGPERRLSDIEIYIVGTTQFGDAVSTVVKTDANGRYQFNDLVPGTYTISLDNPATTTTVENVELNFDGRDVLGTTNGLGAVTNPVANKFQVVFDERGTTIDNLNFALLGLMPKFVNIRDHLASSTSNGVVFGANLGAATLDTQQYWFSLYDGWDGGTSLKIKIQTDVSSATIEGRDANGTLRSVTLSFNNDYTKIRVMGRDGNNIVVRLVGTAEEIFGSSWVTQAEHDQVTMAQPQGEGAEFAAAADEVFGDEAWA